VLVLDMVEILPPLGKYKYDTWRILPMQCYIDNSMRLRSYKRNVTKSSNGMILQGSKPKIFDRLKPYAGKCVKDLPSVSWAIRTSPSHAMGYTPFSLVYGSKAMLLTEVEHKSFRA
jgi:hypothetical protein